MLYIYGSPCRWIHHMCTYMHDLVSPRLRSEYVHRDILKQQWIKPESGTDGTKRLNRRSRWVVTDIMVRCIPSTLKSSSDSVVYTNIHWNFRKNNSKYRFSEQPSSLAFNRLVTFSILRWFTGIWLTERWLHNRTSCGSATTLQGTWGSHYTMVDSWNEHRDLATHLKFSLKKSMLVM